jgi:DNA-binding NtrC family response regulator/tetratricopeptide (TPR) repeat protein
LIGRSRSVRLRELALNTYATRANIALRRFQHARAVSDFETALEIAETIGSAANQAVILNNLGIVYHQTDHYREAIRAFRQAAQTCQKLDQGPSLTFVYGNLAVLYSKTGDFASMQKALEDANSISVGAVTALKRNTPEQQIGRRQSLFLELHGGLALLYNGRYREAHAHFEAAVEIGEEVGDRFVTAFAKVYLAECLVFEARYAEAERRLIEMTAPDVPFRTRQMAFARIAYLYAVTARSKEAKRARETYEKEKSGPPVPFLQAWEDFFFGWAFSLTGDKMRSRKCLRKAEDYFQNGGLKPAASLAGWVEAERWLLAGDTGKSGEALDAVVDSSGDLIKMLMPLLRARLSLAEGASSEIRHRAADLLARAGAAMVGNILPEWQLRLEALRKALGGGEPGDFHRASKEQNRRRRALVEGLPEEAKRKYLGASHWKAWTAVPVSKSPPRTARSPSASREGREENQATTRTSSSPRVSCASTRTIALRGDRGRRASLMARSPSMRRVTEMLNRIRRVDIPVAISGEIGTGKELLARIIHAESRRFARPFQVVDCATIPTALLETELFGAKAGAFTDLTEDRTGLLKCVDGGTLLLEGVPELSESVQTKLLRVLSEGAVRPVGTERPLEIDVRFLFASTRRLEIEVKEGRLRQDLLYRMQVLSVEMPPLRERREDIPSLVELFLRESGELAPRIDREAIDWIRGRPFPGNVRELKNLLSRLRLEHPDRITLEAVRQMAPEMPDETRFSKELLATKALSELKQELEREYLLYHLRRLGGSTQKLSEFLGVGRKYLYRRLRLLGISLRGK